MAIEVKWSEQLRPSDLKTLRYFRDHGLILTKNANSGLLENIKTLPVYQFLIDVTLNPA